MRALQVIWGRLRSSSAAQPPRTALAASRDAVPCRASLPALYALVQTLSPPSHLAQVLSWAPEVYAADAVLSALRSLMAELSALDLARQGAAAAAAAGSGGRPSGRPVIDPTPLREAINALPGQEFKIGGRSFGLLHP